MPAKTRRPLSRERVLRAALELADTRGYGAISMRNVARKLGVEAMSLYNHVANKEDIVDGLIDIVFSEIEVATPASIDWKTAMRDRAISVRAALNRHRWAIGLMEGRTAYGPANIGNHDAVLGCLRGAGFSMEMTVHAYSMQDAYIYGFALQERDMSSETPEDFAAQAQQQMRDYQALLGEYPHIAEVVGGHIAKSGYDYDTEFLFGVDLILESLDKLRDA